jgi:hypothetical protein
MPHEQCRTVYYFNELSDQAKERARQWWREGFDDWWDYIYEDADKCLGLLGFNIKRKETQLLSGKKRYDPAIWFQLSYSQGDGASFDGAWAAADVKPVRAMQAHAPYKPTDPNTHSNKRLHDMAVEANEIKRADKNASAKITSRRDFYIEAEDIEAKTDELADRIKELARDAARWIYDQLRTEYEYQTADEQVDESIMANEYEFTGDGRRAVA